MDNLFKNIDTITGAIDNIYNQIARSREDALTSIRDLLKSIKGNTINLNELDDSFSIAYESRHGDLLWRSKLTKLYYDAEQEGPLSKGVIFELEDGATLSGVEVPSLDIFEIFDLVFKAERKAKIDFINKIVGSHKPYALRLRKDIEVARAVQLTPVLTSTAFEKIDHIAFTEFDEDGAKAFTNFTDGVYINELPLEQLAEIESTLANNEYMVR